MKPNEDPRITICRRSFAISWLFFTLYVAAVMFFSYTLGTEPHILGLPRWLAIGNILVPAIFVVALIFVVEKLIPDIPLTDTDEEEEL
jgi:uncharacterized membrane protein YhdT